MADVQIKCKHTVSPSEPTPKGVVVALSELDQIPGANYVPTVYLYEPSDALSKSMPIINNLKKSLSHALVHYYPLAGRLERVDPRGRLHLHYNALGVDIIEAESTTQIAEFGEFSAPKNFQKLIPLVDMKKPIEELPLFFLQITYMGCGGIALGIMISHAVADGSGLLSFINDWARLARGEPMEALPCHDRTILRAGEPPRQPGSFADKISQLPTLLIHEESLSKKAKEADMVVLPLTSKQIHTLKQAVNADIEPHCRPYSRYEVLSAHIWKCTCKVRRHGTDENRALGIGIDARYRIRGFPKKFFGNTAFVVGARSTAGEIVSGRLGETCGRIRKAIEGVTEERIWGVIELMKEVEDVSVCQRVRGLESVGDKEYVNPNPGVISWLTILICGMDFGWGREVCVSPGTHEFDGLGLLLPGREQGSVIVYMSLLVDQLQEFKKCFYEGIV